MLEPVLVKYRRTFYVEGSNDFHGTDLFEHEIDTGDAKPIRRPPYRVPYALRDELDRQVKTMLDKGIIEPSASGWNFPAFFIPKRSLDGTPKFRFCVDFRALNQVTKTTSIICHSLRRLYPHSTAAGTSVPSIASQVFTR